MTQSLTPMKLISMTCELSVAQRAINLLQSMGVKSVRTSAVRVEEFGNETSVDLHESQLKIEFLVRPEMVSAILEHLQKMFFNHFDVGFYVSDAQVLRPEIFCEMGNAKA
ncbi:MAG: hypothetical protein FJY29_12450 [Betaproteobacteria bacterium]|nr:hypothetical protein [Betaproteobacteria bacterium]